MIPPQEKTEIVRDAFLQRAVEHWMDGMNELSYQPVFCQLLSTLGYSLKYSIKNTHFEMGKDVVAVNPDGVPCGFQLKGGDINLKRWRNEVKVEIETLIDTAIQHPDIDKNIPHLSYLVTNGEISDNVRAEIVALNEHKWKDSPLIYWTRGDLLNEFQKMSDGILPSSAEDYKDLIELIFADGTGLPDIEKVQLFLTKILSVDDETVTNAQRSRDIAGAVLYTSMIMGTYDLSKNHTALVEVQTILLSHILLVVDRYSLADKYWLDSYEIVWANLVNASKQLEKEVDEGALEALDSGAFEQELVIFRKHSAVSTVYALKLSECLSGDDAWKSFLDKAVIKKYEKSLAMWGEASLLPMLFLGLLWSVDGETKDSSKKIITSALNQIIEFNGRKPKHPHSLMPPYWNINKAVNVAFGLDLEELDKVYRSSYYLEPLVNLLVLIDAREQVESVWKEISFMKYEEFQCDENTDFYLYRAKTGKNLTKQPPRTSSWSQMQQDAKKINDNVLPPSFLRFSNFIPFFLLVYPHRLNSEVVKVLVEELE